MTTELERIAGVRGEVPDWATFWRLVGRAISQGEVSGFSPSPTTETPEDVCHAAEAAELVRAAIERGRARAKV